MRALLIAASIAATAVAFPAQAGCKGPTALLAYLVPMAASDFASAKGDVRAKFPTGGEQYANSPSANAVCEDIILEHSLASGNSPENWQVKFDDSHKGSPDAVGLWVIKSFKPILTRYGFPEKPNLYDGQDTGQYVLFWPGPSGTWVRVETFYDPSDKPGFTSYELKVGHNET